MTITLHVGAAITSSITLKRSKKMTSKQTQRLVDSLNRILNVFGESPLPDGAADEEVGLIQAVEAVASRLESTRLTPAAKATMANRLRRKPAARIPSDAAIEARLRAKGIDPKHMPKFA